MMKQIKRWLVLFMISRMSEDGKLILISMSKRPEEWALSWDHRSFPFTARALLTHAKSGLVLERTTHLSGGEDITTTPSDVLTQADVRVLRAAFRKFLNQSKAKALEETRAKLKTL